MGRSGQLMLRWRSGSTRCPRWRAALTSRSAGESGRADALSGPELPDDTSVENVRFATRIRNALNVGGLKTIGEVREASDAALLSLPDFGSGSLSYVREALVSRQPIAFVQRAKGPPEWHRPSSRS